MQQLGHFRGLHEAKGTEVTGVSRCTSLQELVSRGLNFDHICGMKDVRQLCFGLDCPQASQKGTRGKNVRTQSERVPYISHALSPNKGASTINKILIVFALGVGSSSVKWLQHGTLWTGRLLLHPYDSN